MLRFAQHDSLKVSQVEYNISCGYEHYTALARDVANTTFERKFAFSWPNIIPQGIVPHYIAYYEYPAGTLLSDING